MIAPGSEATALVIAEFRKVAKEGGLNMHPIVGRLVDKELLEKMRAKRRADSTNGGDA